MAVFKDESIRMLEILDEMFKDMCYAPDSVFDMYSWRYGGARHAFEELLDQEIKYDKNEHKHMIL